MWVDRWVLPPAIAAAVFMTVVVAPPGGPAARGLRVESLGTPSPSRPLLVRVAVEEAGTARWHAPRTVRLTLASPSGTVHEQAMRTTGASYVLGRVIPPGAGPAVLEVSAEGYTARIPLAVAASPPPGGAVARTETGDSGIGVRVEGGALVPEIAGTVLVRVPDGAGREVELAPSESPLEISPARVRLDACGVAAFSVTTRAMYAHITAEVHGAAPRTASRRLPVAPGGLSVRVQPGSLHAATAVGGRVVYVLGGDDRGPTFWGAEHFDDPPERAAEARAVLPPGTDWAGASLTPSLDPVTGGWATVPAGASCTETVLGARWARATTPLPPVPSPAVLFDGAAQAQHLREGRRQRARRVALALTAVSFAVLIAMVLGAGLRSDPSGLRAVSYPARRRIALAVAGAATLLVGAAVLLTAYWLRV